MSCNADIEGRWKTVPPDIQETKVGRPWPYPGRNTDIDAKYRDNGASRDPG